MKHETLLLTALGIIASFVICIVLLEFRALLLPFAVAVLLSILFHPVIVSFKQRKVPILVSLVAVLGLLGGTLFVLGNLFYASVLPLIEGLPAYQAKLDRVVTDAAVVLGDAIQALGLEAEAIDTQTLLSATTVTAEALSSTLATFVDFMGKAGLVLIFMLFMLAGTGDLTAKVQRAFLSDPANQITSALQSIGGKVRHYLVMRIVLNGVTGLLTLLVLWILGVEFPLFWGFLAFLLSFIPQVGAILSIGLPFVFALLQFDELTRPLLVIGLLSPVYMIMGSVVEPRLLAKALNLSPLLILVALVFWGILWGPWGMILAIPLTTTIKIIFEKIEPLRPISVIMSAGGDE
jgi:predicted PurR-regulated permease PerM